VDREPDLLAGPLAESLADLLTLYVVLEFRDGGYNGFYPPLRFRDRLEPPRLDYGSDLSERSASPVEFLELVSYGVIGWPFSATLEAPYGLPNAGGYVGRSFH
jgi:hypothetical protein